MALPRGHLFYMGEKLKILFETRRHRPLIFAILSKPYFIWSFCCAKLIKAKFHTKLL